MNDIDQAIREALGREDAAMLDRVAGDSSLHRLVLGAYAGPFGFLNVLGTIAGAALVAGAGFCIWRFIGASEVKEMLTWAGLAGLALAGVTLIKVWFWMELQRNAIVREIKRLEFQVARIAAGRRA